MSTTTGSASTQTKTKKEGVQIKGRDVIYLNAPEICFPENAPLKNTEKRELYAILDELFQSGSGGGDEEWQPPEWWLDVPEPEAYEIYFLVQIFDLSNASLVILVSNPENANTGSGYLSIDWGDGTVFESESGWFIGNLSHKYGDIGQYIVKITASEKSCFLQQISGSIVLIAKLGAEIVLNNDEITGSNSYTQRAFYNQYRMQWAVIKGKNGLPRDNAFYNCYALKKVDMAVPPEIIGENTFTDCRCLTKFDFSQVTAVKNNAAYQSGFKKVNAPLCTSVGNTSFSGCYNLQEITVADDCVFGSDCFSECYSLYPRPDGST